MTSVTLHLEDKLSTRLSSKSKKMGVSIDNYIVYVLSNLFTEPSAANDVDLLLNAMQLKGHVVPVDETGKGVFAEIAN